MQELKKEFILNFIEDNRWKYIVDGLKITLIVTIFAVLIGVLLGFLIAIVRTTHDKTGKLKIECNLQGISDCDSWDSGCCTADDHLLYHIRKCGYQ